MFGWMRLQGHKWNHKRVYRVYREMEMNLRIKPKKRIPSRHPLPLAVPSAPHACWSMDFMTDSLTNGDSFRTLNIIDDFNREFLHIEIDKSLPSERVIRSLEMAIEQYRSPQRIRVDNGPEFISGALSRWCTHKGIQLDFIEPGKPTQNAYVERFNKSFRYEVLDVYAFTTLNEARDLATWWMWVYNRERSHSSLGDQTPWIIRCHWRKTQATKALPGIVNKSLAACSPALETC
jgi:putative transposase